MVARTEPYKLSFVGNATVSALGGTIANKAYDAATNTTTADVFIDGVATQPSPTSTTTSSSPSPASQAE